MTHATRAFVISDLHLGGDPPSMMSCPQTLAGFIARLAAMQPSDETIEMVIAGDFVDFLNIKPQRSFTPDPAEARGKLMNTMCQPPFDEVFCELKRFAAVGHRLTILVGNHDVELALPPVQDALLHHLSAAPRQVQFVDDGRAYRIGRALIEHGNRYDGANVNDWTGLRAIVSALSRHEEPPVQLEVSAGSRIVEKAINPIKERYSFIDLLQPAGELVALLLVAFEPGLVTHWDKLARLFHAQRLQNKNRWGRQPGKTSQVSHQYSEVSDILEDPELARAFDNIGGVEVYHTLRQPPHTSQVAIRDVLSTAWKFRKDSLAEILDRGDTIPQQRLHQIRLAMRRMLLGDESACLDGPTGPYGKAAERIRASSKGAVEVVVMGHTHQARHIGPARHATYINTGTWADTIRVPDAVLADGSDDELTDFLARLFRDERSNVARPYAELAIASDGRVSSAELRWEVPCQRQRKSVDF